MVCRGSTLLWTEEEIIHLINLAETMPQFSYVFKVATSERMKPSLKKKIDKAKNIFYTTEWMKISKVLMH
jgi:hypothetical protein